MENSGTGVGSMVDGGIGLMVDYIKRGLDIETLARTIFDSESDPMTQIFDGKLQDPDGNEWVFAFNATKANGIMSRNIENVERFSREPLTDEIKDWVVTCFNGDGNYAMSTNLTKPVIGIMLPFQRTYVIDGWHRMYKAVKLNRDSIILYMLNEEEQKECELYMVKLAPAGENVSGMTAIEITTRLIEAAEKSWQERIKNGSIVEGAGVTMVITEGVEKLEDTEF